VCVCVIGRLNLAMENPCAVLGVAGTIADASCSWLGSAARQIIPVGRLPPAVALQQGIGCGSAVKQAARWGVQPPCRGGRPLWGHCAALPPQGCAVHQAAP